MQRRSKGGQRKRDEPGEVEGASTSTSESPKPADKAKAQDALKTPEAQKLREKTRTPGSSGRVNLLKQGLEETR